MKDGLRVTSTISHEVVGNVILSVDLQSRVLDTGRFVLCLFCQRTAVTRPYLSQSNMSNGNAVDVNPPPSAQPPPTHRVKRSNGNDCPLNQPSIPQHAPHKRHISSPFFCSFLPFNTPVECPPYRICINDVSVLPRFLP